MDDGTAVARVGIFETEFITNPGKSLLCPARSAKGVRSPIKHYRRAAE
jgi:hypothetical protein